MTVVGTILGLGVLFAVGVVAGMVSAAGSYAHLQRRHGAAIRALEQIRAMEGPTAGVARFHDPDGHPDPFETQPGTVAGRIAMHALTHDRRLANERPPRALD